MERGGSTLSEPKRLRGLFLNSHVGSLLLCKNGAMAGDTRLTQKAGDGAIKVEMENLVPLPQVAEQAAHPLQPAHLGKPHDHHHHHHHDHHHHHQQVLPAVSAT